MPICSSNAPLIPGAGTELQINPSCLSASPSAAADLTASPRAIGRSSRLPPRISATVITCNRSSSRFSSGFLYLPAALHLAMTSRAKGKV